MVFGSLCDKISFQSVSLGSLQLGFHIIAFLADLSEANGRPGNLIYAHSQWKYPPLTLVLGKRGGGYCSYSLGSLGGASCLACASVLSKFCDSNSCQSFSSTVFFYRLQIYWYIGAVFWCLVLLAMITWPILQVLKLQQEIENACPTKITAVPLPGSCITCCVFAGSIVVDY